MKMVHMTAGFELENKADSITVSFTDKEGEKVDVYVHGDWEILVCNNEEERAYRIVKTKHGGYELEERTLL